MCGLYKVTIEYSYYEYTLLKIFSAAASCETVGILGTDDDRFGWWTKHFQLSTSLLCVKNHQLDSMNFLEMNMEVLECARYGEDDDLRALLQAGADVNYADEGGSSALHKAAANGEVACIKVLHTFGAKYSKNGQGNTAAHWAAQNGKAPALKAILESYEVDVLAKNDLGRSILTEAFQSKCTDCIELCLSHSSATEERLINPEKADAAKAAAGQSDNAHTAAAGNTAEVVMETDNDDEGDMLDVENAVTHTMQFGASTLVKVRELPITRADNPFGSDTSPEDDTTGTVSW